MTAKDYVLIATAIRNTTIPAQYRNRIAEEMAKELKKENERFDFGRFISATTPHMAVSRNNNS